MKAWSTIRKRANESGYFARQVVVDNNSTPVYMLLDCQNNIRLATRSRSKIQNMVYELS